MANGLCSGAAFKVGRKNIPEVWSARYIQRSNRFLRCECILHAATVVGQHIEQFVAIANYHFLMDASARAFRCYCPRDPRLGFHCAKVLCPNFRDPRNPETQRLSASGTNEKSGARAMAAPAAT
jgi:hypothetical protein